jgi:hypothetical protein
LEFKILGRMRRLELDEMHTYIGSKKNIAGYGVLLIEMQNRFLHWAQGGAVTEQKL